jgi:hypothetical protein
LRIIVASPKALIDWFTRAHLGIPRAEPRL